MLAISSGGLYRPGMTLFQSDVAWWWLSPDCMFFYGCFPSPSLVCLFGWGVLRHLVLLDLLDPLGAFESLEGLEASVNPLRLLQRAFLARLCWSLLLGEVLFTGRVPWRPLPQGSVHLDLDRVFFSPSLPYCSSRKCLDFPRQLLNSAGLIFLP